MKTVDVGSLLDEGPWSGYQKLLVARHGADDHPRRLRQPAARRGRARAHARMGSAARAAFAPVLTSGMVGMMIGGFIGGFIGDRLGRRVALLGSVISFGVLTVLVSVADSVLTLGVLRFFAGLGLGGAMPNAAALSSEYVPRRHRPFAVTLTIVCIPLGGTLAGFVGAQMLPRSAGARSSSSAASFRSSWRPSC